MNRSLKLSALLALALGSSQAMAALGQVQVKSALGQPLVAEIPVRPDSPAELRNLSVTLASDADFSHAGLGARPAIPLQFSVVDGLGGKLIRITSSQEVNTPYLDLLIEMHSAAGKTLQEVTVLLDPPGMNQAPAVSAPRVSAPARAAAPTAPTAPAAASAARATPTPRPAPSVPSQRAAGTGDYTVRRGDTLSSVARQSGLSGSPDQVLLALKQANPQAFFRDNVNALKSGAILRMPAQSQVDALAAAQASAEIRRQNQAWRSGAAALRGPTTVADAATVAKAAPAATTAPGDRLALVPAQGQGQAAGSRGGSGKANAANAMAEQQARMQESLTALEQQGNELRSRVKDLEDINSKNERLLALKDNEIADLQHKLALAQQAAAKPAPAASAAAKGDIFGAPAASASTAKATTVPAPTPAAAPVPAAATSAAAAAPAPATAPAPAAAPSAPPAASKPLPPSPSTPPMADDPWFMQPWVWALAGGAVIVLLLLAMAARRRRAAAAAAAGVAAGVAGASLADHFIDDPREPVVSGGADADQDELLDQLAEHPDDVGLHLELVSLYYARRDVDHFEAAAEAMYAHVSDPQQAEWQDVMRMGRDLVPNHPLFVEPAVAVAPPVGHDLDLDAHYRFDDMPAPAQPGLETPSFPPLHEPRDEPPVERYADPFELPAHTPPSFDAHDATEDAFGLPPEDRPPPLPTPPATEEPASTWVFDEPELQPPAFPQVHDQSADAAASESHWHLDGAPEPSPAFAAPHEPSVIAPDWHLDTAAPVDHRAADAPLPEEPAVTEDAFDTGGLSHFSDDPVDTKLDLARAYMDMGDADGARAMLEEVQQEGSQMQQDVARKLLAELD